MAGTITVFSTNNCAVCKTLKQWLKKQQIEFDSVNLEQDPSRQAEIIQKAGSMQVPISLIIDDNGQETVITGPQYRAIKKALGISR